MAEANSQLNILVKIRDEASAALSRLSSDISELGGSLNFAGAKGGILAGALAAIAGGAVITAFKNFEQGELALAKMDAILRTIPGGIEKYRDQIIRAADGALKFGFDNEKAALNITKLFKTTGDINFALQAFQASMDLARLMGIDLDDATQALILAFQGGGRTLKQLGIDIDEHASKQTILQAVINATKGQAEAFTQTSIGTREILARIGGEVLEIFGEPFAKTFELIGALALKHFDSIIKFIRDPLTPIIQGLIPLFMSAIGFGLASALAFGLSKIGIFSVGFLSTFGPAGLLIGAFAGFIILLIAKWEQFRAAGQIAMENIKAAWQAGWNFIQNIVAGVLSTVQGYVASIVSSFERIKSAVEKGAAFVGSGATTIINKILSFLPFQEGGIITRPTLGLIGEAGPEAVIPLNRLAGAGIGGNIIINLHGDFYTDSESAERWANQIAKIIKFQLKL